MVATRRFGYLGGGLLTALGALGLAVTGLAEPGVSAPQRLLVLEVTPVQNLMHLALGLAMVAGGAADSTVARRTAAAAAAALAMLGVVGILMPDPATTPLGTGTSGIVLHLGLAAWGATATLRRPASDAQPGHRETSPARSAGRPDAVRHP